MWPTITAAPGRLATGMPGSYGPELPGNFVSAWRRKIRACWGVRYAVGPTGIHRTVVLLEARRTLSASSALLISKFGNYEK
jgi:hypothetical protein